MRTLVPAVLLALPLAGWMSSAGPEPLAAKGFAFELSTVVPVTPAEAFDAFTGDVAPWWDHTFSGKPHSLTLDPRPGGAFAELFDDAGNGVVHATVNMAKRGEELQFRGPMGFAGEGINVMFNHRVRFRAEGEGSTRVTVGVRAIGEVRDEWPAVVEQVWHHFLVERYAAYVSGTLEGGGR